MIMATGVAAGEIRQSYGSANSLEIDSLAHSVDDQQGRIEEEHLEGREVTHNEAYIHVVKLDEKKRMFGASELAKSIASDLSTSTSDCHSQTTLIAYHKCNNRWKKLTDRLSQMQQQLAISQLDVYSA